MRRNLASLARSLSFDEIEALLVIKEQLVEAETRRAEVEEQLHRIDGEIADLVKKLGKSGARRGATKRAASGRRKAGATSRGRGKGRGGKSLEDVVVDLIHSRGKPMLFPDIKNSILRRNLFATRSKNFDNVLRRTISTSKKIRRVARGTYTA